MNLGRLKASQVIEGESGPSRRSSDGIRFSPDCIFSNKTGLKKIMPKEVWTSENVSRCKFGEGKTVRDAVLRKNDQKLHCRIACSDLFACEAVYHNSCRDYLRNQAAGRSKDEKSRKQQHELEEGHSSAFSEVRERIDQGSYTRKKGSKIN